MDSWKLVWTVFAFASMISCVVISAIAIVGGAIDLKHLLMDIQSEVEEVTDDEHVQ